MINNAPNILVRCKIVSSAKTSKILTDFLRYVRLNLTVLRKCTVYWLQRLIMDKQYYFSSMLSEGLLREYASTLSYINIEGIRTLKKKKLYSIGSHGFEYDIFP